MKSTWEHEPEKRPSFTDIVQFFDKQNIEVLDTAVVDNTNDSGYIDIFQT